MLERLLLIVDTLFMIDDTPNSQRRWRFLMAFAVCGFVFHIAWACGFIPNLGGFALAADVTKSTKDLDDRLTSIEKTILKGQYQAQYTQLMVELRRLDQDIFDIESKVAQLNKEGVRPDTFYTNRLRELKYDREGVARKLESFVRTHPELVE